MKLKKVLSTIMICIISLCLVACNSSNKPKVATINADDDIIMTIYAYDGVGESKFGLINLGHSFLSFENKTTETIMIGPFDLGAGETVAISSWSISEHFGIWYNTENNYIKYHDKYNGRVSVSVGLKIDCLETLNNFIKNNDNWYLTKNCTNFSVGLWNTLCEESERVSTPLIYTPSRLSKDIKSFTTYEKNRDIPVSDRFGYFDSCGNFVQFAFASSLVEVENA